MEKATIETMVTMLSLEATTTMMTISLKPRMLMTVTLEARTVMMVTLEARTMTNMGNPSSWKGFKLSRTHNARNTRGHKRRGYELEFGTNEARKYGSWVRHEHEDKDDLIKETRWPSKARMLD